MNTISKLSGTKSVHISHDINNDGFKDSLIIEKSGGSDYSGIKCTFKNGASEELLIVESGGYFNEIRRIVVIPKKFKERENLEFFKIAKFILVPNELHYPDQSLQWILSGLTNRYELTENEYFSEIFRIKTKWYDSLILPTTYSIRLNPKKLKKYNQKDKDIDRNDTSGYSGWMIYYGHNHYRNKNCDSLTTMYESNNYSIYRTSHAVIVKKDKKYCWAFVTDSELTGSPSKLRWESIKDVLIINEFIVVLQTNPIMFRDQLFIIDLKKGICGNVKFENNHGDLLFIKNNRISVESEGENKKVIILEKHFNELLRLSENLN